MGKLNWLPHPIYLILVVFWLAVAVAECGCASAPKTRVGPCVTTACGDVCCNNDGRVCPPCDVKP